MSPDPQRILVIGAQSASFEMLRALVQRLPAMICPRWVDTRSQYWWVPPAGLNDHPKGFEDAVRAALDGE